MPVPVDTSALYSDARAFLAELARNNNRDWFGANKDRYDSLLKRPAERLMADLAPVLERQAGTTLRRKLFRPHRDIRFTEDKTPYHSHLHLMWSHPDGRVWMFGLSPDYATAGAGIMQFAPQAMDRWRAALDADGATLQAMLARGGWRLDPPELKRVPAPFAADHPQEALLRRKGAVIWRDGLDDGLQTDPVATLAQAFADMGPVLGWLERIV